MNDRTANTGRRRIVLRAGLAAIAAPVVAVALSQGAAAQQKLPKNLIQYQDSPKGDHLCANCTHFQPPNACAIVEGEIAANGWCAAWAPKG